MNPLLLLLILTAILVIVSRGSPSRTLKAPLRWLWRAAQFAGCLAVLGAGGVVQIYPQRWDMYPPPRALWQIIPEPYWVIAFGFAPAAVLYALALLLTPSAPRGPS